MMDRITTMILTAMPARIRRITVRVLKFTSLYRPIVASLHGIFLESWRTRALPLYSSLPEVVGNGALKLEPLGAAGLASQMYDLLTSENTRRGLA